MPSIDRSQGKQASGEWLAAQSGTCVSESSPSAEQRLYGASPHARTSRTGTRFINRLLVRYLVAVIAVVLAFLIREALVRRYGELPAFITVYPSVILVAMLGDIWAGLLATGLSALVVVGWLLPQGRFAISHSSNVICLAIFCMTGICVSVVAELYHRKRERLTGANAQLRADITERRRIEEALRLSEEKFEKAFANNPAAIGITRLEDGVCLDLNDTWAELVGYSREELIGHSPRKMNIWPTPEAAARFVKELREKGSLHGWEQEFLKKSGEVFVAELSAQVLVLSGEELVLSTLIDITARKRAEKALRDSEGRFRAFFDTMVVGMAELDLDGRFVQVNQCFCQITGYSREELLGMTPADLTHPEERERNLEQTMACLQGRLPVYDTEKRYVRKDGGVIWVHVTAAMIRDAEGNLLRSAGIIQDITERKQAEQALLRSEKLASVGRMAATIAHEINNPLEAVTNTIFIAKRVEGLPKSAGQYLDIADAELNRIAHITRQALGFYRESNSPSLTSVTAVLDSAVELLKSKIKAKHAVIKKQWDSDIQVTAVASELRQVFANLLANSLDAIPETGIITLRASVIAASGGSHCCARITVADNGKGIRAGLRQQVFEPFFTTKDTVGTGLGLWLSKQIVDKHGGTIRVRSNTDGPRRGTTISVLLPAAPIAHRQPAAA